jgi:hypothetical protein
MDAPLATDADEDQRRLRPDRRRALTVVPQGWIPSGVGEAVVMTVTPRHEAAEDVAIGLLIDVAGLALVDRLGHGRQSSRSTAAAVRRRGPTSVPGGIWTVEAIPEGGSNEDRGGHPGSSRTLGDIT